MDNKSPEHQKRMRRLFLIGAVVVAGVALLIFLWTKNNQSNGSGNVTLSPNGFGGAGPESGHSGQLQNGSGSGASSQLYIVPFGSGGGSAPGSSGQTGASGVTIGSPAPASAITATPSALSPVTGGVAPISPAVFSSSASSPATAAPNTAAAYSGGLGQLGATPVSGYVNTASPLTGQLGVPIATASATQSPKAPANVAAQGVLAGSPTVTVGSGYNSPSVTPASVYTAHTYVAQPSYASSYHTVSAVAQTPGKVTYGGAPAGVVNAYSRRS